MCLNYHLTKKCDVAQIPPLNYTCCDTGIKDMICFK